MAPDLCDSVLFNTASNLMSAIVGAGAAAIPAFFLARKASREMLARDLEMRKQLQRTAMLRAVVKLSKIINGLGGLNRHIEESIATGEKELRENPYLWTKVPPIVGMGDHKITFEANELAPLLEVKEADLLNRLLELSDRYVALNEGIQVYTHRRTLTTDQLSASMNGAVGTIGLTVEQKTTFEPRFVELDSLVSQLREMTYSHYVSALDIAKCFGPAAKRATGDPSFPALDVSKAILPIEPPQNNASTNA